MRTAFAVIAAAAALVGCRQRIAAGTPRDAYYAEWVMKKGLRALQVAN